MVETRVSLSGNPSDSSDEASGPDGAAATFHVLVLAPLRASEEHATNDAWTAPVKFTRAEFDLEMAPVAPTIEFEITVGGEKKRTTHGFRAMKAFRPDVLMEQASVLRALRAGASNVPPPISRSVRMKAVNLVEDILSASEPEPELNVLDGTLYALVEHPEVRALERAWRGVQFLAERAPKNVVIEAMDASADNVETVLAKLAGRIDAGPVDLIVVDHTIGSSARDLGRLEKWATIAEGMGAPLVANGSAELLGADSIAALGKSSSRLRDSADPRAAAFRSAAGKDVMRWVTLALNGVLARPKHAGPVRKTFGVNLDEKSELFLGAAIGVAALAAQSFGKAGWAIPPAGVLEQLPVRVIDGASVATEAPANQDSAKEAAAAGIALFCSAANQDVAVLPDAPTVHRAPSTQGGAPSAATHSLADQMFVARIANAIIQLAAAIPSNTPEGAARDVVRVALAELFGESGKKPEVDVKITGAPAMLEVTIRPRGFGGVKLEEATLGAPLAH